MKYKAIILDLDDTTVVHGRENFPTPRVANAIAQAKKLIHVCIATARPLIDTLPIMKYLELSGPCIVSNGTQIYDPVTNKIIQEICMNREVISKIYSICKKNALMGYYYDGMKDVEYTGGTVPDKVLSVYIPEIEPSRLEGLVSEFQPLQGVMVHKLTGWDKRFMSINITDALASKLHGVVEVARILDIKTGDIIGVGDGYVDFPLLMACGLKIAMGNAVPELKAIADFIAPTVYEDGVAVVIEKFIL